MPGLGVQLYATVADAVAVAAPAQARDDGMAKAEEMIVKLKAENLALHGELTAKKAVYARALMDNARLQRDIKKVVKEKEKTERLLTGEQAKREN